MKQLKFKNPKLLLAGAKLPLMEKSKKLKTILYSLPLQWDHALRTLCNTANSVLRPLYSCSHSFNYLKNSIGRDILERIQIFHNFWREKNSAKIWRVSNFASKLHQTNMFLTKKLADWYILQSQTHPNAFLTRDNETSKEQIMQEWLIRLVFVFRLRGCHLCYLQCLPYLRSKETCLSKVIWS